MIYKVLKDFAGGKEGSVLTEKDVESFTVEYLNELVVDETLEPIEGVPLSGETVPYTVTQEFLDANPDAGLEVGQEIQIPKEVADLNFAPAVHEEAPMTDLATQEKGLYYNGELVITDGYREVNGINHRHIKIATGAEFDLTEEEYQAFIQSNN